MGNLDGTGLGMLISVQCLTTLEILVPISEGASRLIRSVSVDPESSHASCVGWRYPDVCHVGCANVTNNHCNEVAWFNAQFILCEKLHNWEQTTS